MELAERESKEVRLRQLIRYYRGSIKMGVGKVGREPKHQSVVASFTARVSNDVSHET